MTERPTGGQDVPGGPKAEDEFDQTGQDQEQPSSLGKPMDEVEFDRVKGSHGQPMDEPEFDRVKGSRGQPMDEPEFD